MRIRSTKPEFWKSRRIASVSWEARLVLKGLESYVDDNGVGIDDIELIVTDVFPRDMFANGSETVARVSEAITELHQAGLVWRYEGESDHLLYISFWEDIQRIDKPGKGRNPRPDGTFEYKESLIRESVASPPETLAPGTGEQGNRGTEEQRNRGTEEQRNRGTEDSLSDGEPSDPKTLIPDDWQPTQKHRAHAKSLGIDVDSVAQHFINHAHRNARTLVKWDTAFTNWMNKSVVMRQQRSGQPQHRGQSALDHNLDLVARLENKYGQGAIQQ